jgi:hypothetical protein
VHGWILLLQKLNKQKLVLSTGRSKKVPVLRKNMQVTGSYSRQPLLPWMTLDKLSAQNRLIKATFKRQPAIFRPPKS